MISTAASTDSSDRLVVKPRMMPARSETKNQPLSSMSPSQSESNGRVIRPTSGTGGDCRCPPPGASVNSSRDRYSVKPGRQDVDRDTGDDVVDADGDGDQAEQQAAEQTADDAEEHPGPRPPLVTGVAGAEGAEDHHSLDADVDHAGPLRPEPGQPGQRDRNGRGDRRLDGAGGIEVVRAGPDPHQRDHGDAGGHDAQPRPTGGSDRRRLGTARALRDRRPRNRRS